MKATGETFQLISQSGVELRKARAFRLPFMTEHVPCTPEDAVELLGQQEIQVKTPTDSEFVGLHNEADLQELKASTQAEWEGLPHQQLGQALSDLEKKGWSFSVQQPPEEEGETGAWVGASVYTVLNELTDAKFGGRPVRATDPFSKRALEVESEQVAKEMATFYDSNAPLVELERLGYQAKQNGKQLSAWEARTGNTSVGKKNFVTLEALGEDPMVAMERFNLVAEAGGNQSTFEALESPWDKLTP